MSGHHRVGSSGSASSGGSKHAKLPEAAASSDTGGGGGGGGGGDGGGAAPLSEEERGSMFEYTYAMPQARSVDSEHAWDHLDASKFNIRGHNYLVDGKKIVAGPAVFEVAHVATFLCDQKVERLAERADSYVRRAAEAGDDRFFVIVVYQTPTSPFVHLVIVLAAPHDVGAGDPAFKRAWSRFLADDTDEIRTRTWKVIPSIAEGSWVVKKAVGAKPAILPTKLTHKWHRGENYLEVDCDVASSTVATVLVNLIVQYARGLVIDLAFVVQGDRVDELPERVLGCVRLMHMDMAGMPRRLVECEGTHYMSAGGSAASGGPEGSESDEESSTHSR